MVVLFKIRLLLLLLPTPPFDVVVVIVDCGAGIKLLSLSSFKKIVEEANVVVAILVDDEEEVAVDAPLSPARLSIRSALVAADCDEAIMVVVFSVLFSTDNDAAAAAALPRTFLCAAADIAAVVAV